LLFIFFIIFILFFIRACIVCSFIFIKTVYTIYFIILSTLFTLAFIMAFINTIFKRVMCTVELPWIITNYVNRKLRQIANRCERSTLCDEWQISANLIRLINHELQIAPILHLTVLTRKISITNLFEEMFFISLIKCDYMCCD